MQYAALILLQLAVLYWLSLQFHLHLGRFFYRIFRNEQAVMYTLNIMFWPGVLVHELAHLIVGRLLLVKTHGLTIIPRKGKGRTITMGSVQVPATDRFRFFLIGTAPIYVGLGLLFIILWLTEQYQLLDYWVWWVVIGYLVLQIGNNMFLSDSDVQGSLWLLLFFSIIFGLLYWMGWRPSIDALGMWLSQNELLFTQASYWLWVPIVVNVAGLSIMWWIPALLHRMVYR